MTGLNWKKTHDDLLLMLTNKHKGVYDKITKYVLFSNGCLFFLYRYGGTGKTLYVTIRSKGVIVLN